jgi:hypothetical protein
MRETILHKLKFSYRGRGKTDKSPAATDQEETEPDVPKESQTIFYVKPKSAGVANTLQILSDSDEVLFTVSTKVLSPMGRAYTVLARDDQEYMTTEQAHTVVFPRHDVMHGKNWFAMILLSVAVTHARGELITIQDTGDATEEAEGAIISDSYARSQDPFRGRYSDKLYLANQHKGEKDFRLSALRFNDLKKKIGKKKIIQKATLILECTNAQGAQPVEVMAYPFLESWDLNAFSWSGRLIEKKQAWNKDPAHLNIEPGDDEKADTDEFDFARKFEKKKIEAKAKLETTGKTHMEPGAIAKFDVTDVVTLWYEGKLDNHGWALVTTGKGNYVRFFATNGDGMSPRLDIEVE